MSDNPASETGSGFKTYDLTRLTQWLSGLLLVYLVAEIIFGILVIVGLSNVDRVNSGDIALAERIDTWTGTIAITFLIALIICFIVGGIWIYRAAANTMPFVGATGRIRPGWSVGWFAIPIANLWMPFRAMRQTWNLSRDPSDPDPNRQTSGNLLTVWWTCWVASQLLGQASARSDMWETSLVLDAINIPFSIIAVLAFRKIVLQIAAAQARFSGTAIAEVFE